MIKVTVGNIMNAIPTLNKLVGASFAGRKAFIIARLIREINQESDIFDTSRAELIRRYAEKDEDGELIVTDGNVHIPPEDLAKCNEELLILQNTEVEINADKLPIEWFEDIDLTPAEATLIEPFVAFEFE